jgi:hypothetical protein
MVHHRDIVELLIGEENAPLFAEWAWGPNFKTLVGKELCEEWNKLHGNDLTIYMNGKLNKDIPKMIEIWKKQLPKHYYKERINI